MDISKEYLPLTVGFYGNLFRIYIYIYIICGPGSSVGITTDYGLDDPGSNPGEDEIFLPSRPTLGPTQPPVQLVPGLSRGVKVRPGRATDHSHPSSAMVMEQYSYTSTQPLGHTRPVTGSLCLYIYIYIYIYIYSFKS